MNHRATAEHHVIGGVTHLCHADDHYCPEGLREALLRVKEDLVLIAAPEADRVRDVLTEAVRTADAETVRREGHLRSGRIALSMLRLADEIDGGPQGAAGQ